MTNFCFMTKNLFHDKKHSPQFFCVTKDDVMYLYFGSKSKIGFFSLHDEMKAFLGFYFNGEPINLDKNDYHENLLSQIFFNEASFKLKLENDIYTVGFLELTL